MLFDYNDDMGSSLAWLCTWGLSLMAINPRLLALSQWYGLGHYSCLFGLTLPSINLHLGQQFQCRYMIFESQNLRLVLLREKRMRK